MSEFLQLNTPADFWNLLKEKADIYPRGKEKIQFNQGLNRVLAVDLFAPESLPPFDRSIVDGFAVRARDTAGASASLPVYLQLTGEVVMGEETNLSLGPGQAVRIPTGGMLPAGADAVIMVEETDYLDDETVETSSAVASGENLVSRGEDIAGGDLLLEQGHLLRAQDIGALAALGITEVEVYKQPGVTVISTGDELISPEEKPAPGEIRDINTYTISSVLQTLGCRVKEMGVVKDSFERLQQVVRENLDSDLILISGGSSVGLKDMTVDLINSLGEPGVLLHGIAVKPGKPTILGVIEGLPIIGLPGHPASAWTITNVLVRPLVLSLLGMFSKSENEENEGSPNPLFFQPVLEAVLSRNIVSARGREEYIPVRLVKTGRQGEDGESYLAEPVTGKSSLITTLVQAAGFIRIDTFCEGLNKGHKVGVQLFSSMPVLP